MMNLRTEMKLDKLQKGLFWKTIEHQQIDSD